MSAKKTTSTKKVVADNRRARHDYHIEETMEAGIMLVGSEVKALRDGRATIAESYVSVRDETVELINANIPIFAAANRQNHEPTRPRKLLLHKREVAKLATATQRQGRTIVPLRLYFNARGFVKLEIAIAVGKKLHDKRMVDKTRDWKREQGRILRSRG